MPKNTKTVLFLDRFEALDLDDFNQRYNRQIKGIILDYDDCIAHEKEPINDLSLIHCKKIFEKGFKIALLSNGNNYNRYSVLKRYVSIIKNVRAKPAVESFDRAIEVLNLKSKDVLMVGDSYITDAGCLRAGIDFVKIVPLRKKNEKIILKIKKFPIRFVSGFYSILGIFYNKYLLK